jgi:thymidylate kinase
MTHNLSGKYILIDGLDGIGKGCAIRGITNYCKGKNIFNVDVWEKRGLFPEIDDFAEHSMLVCSEPTYAGVGREIREELTCRASERSYSARSVAQAFALDRLVFFRRVIIPALTHEKIVVQSRSLPSSLVYQPRQALEQEEEELTYEELFSLEGNALALQYAPDVLIIPTINDVDALVLRLQEREKKDDSIFENIAFQTAIKPAYESDELRELYEALGTRVVYVDAGISEESTASQTVAVVRELLSGGLSF